MEEIFHTIQRTVFKSIAVNNQIIFRIPLWHSIFSVWHCHCSSPGHCWVQVQSKAQELPHVTDGAKKKKKKLGNIQIIRDKLYISNFYFKISKFEIQIVPYGEALCYNIRWDSLSSP